MSGFLCRIQLAGGFFMLIAANVIANKNESNFLTIGTVLFFCIMAANSISHGLGELLAGKKE